MLFLGPAEKIIKWRLPPTLEWKSRVQLRGFFGASWGNHVTKASFNDSPTVERKTASDFYWLKNSARSFSCLWCQVHRWTVPAALADSWPGVGRLPVCWLQEHTFKPSIERLKILSITLSPPLLEREWIQIPMSQDTNPVRSFRHGFPIFFHCFGSNGEEIN